MYCNKDDVEALLNLKFDSESQPTEAKVLLFIQSIASELNLVLRKAGSPIPPTNTDVINTLRTYNGYGASGLVALSYGGNMESVEASQGAYYRREYKEFMKSVLEDTSLLLPDTTISGGLVASTNVTDGYTPMSVVEDRQGDDWTP